MTNPYITNQTAVEVTQAWVIAFHCSMMIELFIHANHKPGFVKFC